MKTYYITIAQEAKMPTKYFIDINGKTEEYSSLEDAEKRAEKIEDKKINWKPMFPEW